MALSCWILLVVLTAIYGFKELSMVYHQRWKYLWELESWLHIVINVCFVLTSFQFLSGNPFRSEMKVAKWQYHVNGIAVFLTWLLQTLIVARIPRFGLYVQIFCKITWSFLNVFFVLFFLCVAFAMSFASLFPEHRSFANPAVIIKVLAMMLGEVDYDQLYDPQAGEATPIKPGSDAY